MIGADGTMWSQMSLAERDRFERQWQRPTEQAAKDAATLREMAEVSEHMERAKQLSPAERIERLKHLPYEDQSRG
jgi:hypothetical protein